MKKIFFPVIISAILFCFALLINKPITAQTTNAVISVKTVDGANNPQEGIVFKCIQNDEDGSQVKVENLTSDPSGEIVWNVNADNSSTYSCEAVSNYPPCFVPPSDSQKKVIVDSLKAGDLKEFTLVWVFDKDQEYQDSTCEELYNKEETEDQLAPIAKATIPANYSVTPDIKNLTVTDAKEVKDLTITYTGSSSSFSCSNSQANNAVQWVDTVDLSGDNMESVFSNLDNYLKLGDKGKIEIDFSSVSALNSKRIKVSHASLNLKLDSEQPLIVVDGKEAGVNQVSDVSYENNTVSFITEKGKVLAIRPRIEVEQCSDDSRESGTCSISGKVDNLCSEIILNVSGDLEKEETLEVSETGTFEYELTDLQKDGKYDISVTATAVNGEENEVSWKLGETIIDQAKRYGLWILLIILVIVIFVVLTARSKKKKALTKEELEQKAKVLVTEIRKLTQSLKERVGKIDLQDEEKVKKFNMLSDMNKQADQIEEDMRPPENEEEKPEFNPQEFQEKLDKLETEFKKFKDELLQEVTIDQYGKVDNMDSTSSEEI